MLIRNVLFLHPGLSLLVEYMLDIFLIWSCFSLEEIRRHDWEVDVTTRRVVTHDALVLPPLHPDAYLACYNLFSSRCLRPKMVSSSLIFFPCLLKTILPGITQLPLPDSEWHVRVALFRLWRVFFFAEGQEKHSIVEFKGGKIIFKQKPISFHKQSETLQGAVNWLDSSVTSNNVANRNCGFSRHARGTN